MTAIEICEHIVVRSKIHEQNIRLREALKKLFFLGIIPKPADPPHPPIGTFRNENVNFGQI